MEASYFSVCVALRRRLGLVALVYGVLFFSPSSSLSPSLLLLLLLPTTHRLLFAQLNVPLVSSLRYHRYLNPQSRLVILFDLVARTT